MRIRQVHECRAAYALGMDVVLELAYDAIHTGIDRIGAGYHNQDVFDGLLDEVAVYGRALSAAEIQTIFRAGSSGKAR